MSTRAIRTSTPQTVCDVCGRTLLRGERAEIYLAGVDRHSVCELCTSRALHGGWVREGAIPDYGPASERVDRRRPRLLRRARRRPAEAEPDPGFEAPPPFADAPSGAPDEFDPLAGATEPVVEIAPEGSEPETARTPDDEPGSAPEWPPAPPRSTRRSRRRRASPLRDRAARGTDRGSATNREPRHVHAVPTSVEHKIDAAVELFNGSEHPRTVAGIARSLGLPDVSVHPTTPVGAIVDIVVAWELCWYRYEVDLSEQAAAVRGAGQGYELSELSALERDCNAAADDYGRLAAARA